jgi:hypothetical protein
MNWSFLTVSETYLQSLNNGVLCCNMLYVSYMLYVCHMSSLGGVVRISSHCHKRGSATMLLICLTHYIHKYRPIGSDNLEWSIIRRTNPFAKIFHDDGISKFPTLQGSLAHRSVFLLDMCVPLLELLHDLRRAFKVLWIWFALLHLFRTVRKPQVLPAVDRSKKVDQSSKQASFRVTLLCASLLRERTSQDLVRVHCCYWSMVVLWSGLHRSGDPPTTWR